MRHDCCFVGCDTQNGIDVHLRLDKLSGQTLQNNPEIINPQKALLLIETWSSMLMTSRMRRDDRSPPQSNWQGIHCDVNRVHHRTNLEQQPQRTFWEMGLVGINISMEE